MKKHVIIGIPVLLWGGTEIQCLTLIRALQEMGYSVTVCCYHEYDLSMVETMKKTGAHVDLLEIDRATGYPAAFRIIRKYFRTRQPDVVHIRYIAPGLVPILAARAAGVKTVFVTLGQLGTPYGMIPKLLIRVAAFFSTCIICTSQALEKSWFRKSTLYRPGSEPVGRHCTVYNGIRIDSVSKQAGCQESRAAFIKKFGIPADKKLLAVVGRLRHEKGQVVALRAMQRIAAQNPDTLLLFAGEGPDEQMLKRETRKMGLDDHVRFLGRLGIDDIFSLYGLAGCIIIPSIHEGFGLIAVEAMAAGAPIVATNVGGLRDIIVDGVTGYLAPVTRVDILASKVLTILSSEELARKMGHEGFQRAVDVFSYEAYFENMSSLYGCRKKRLGYAI